MSNKPPILLVEDNEDHVLLLQYALEQAGILDPVQVASSGEDAIDYLAGTGKYSDWKQFPLPSFVLLDLKLPGIKGLDVLKWIRQQPGLKLLRVAMLSSSEFEREIQQAYEIGANIFLTKPVRFEKLVEMMKELHGHWVQQAQAPEVSRDPPPMTPDTLSWNG